MISVKTSTRLSMVGSKRDLFAISQRLQCQWTRSDKTIAAELPPIRRLTINKRPTNTKKGQLSKMTQRCRYFFYKNCELSGSCIYLNLEQWQLVGNFDFFSDRSVHFLEPNNPIYQPSVTSLARSNHLWYSMAWNVLVFPLVNATMYKIAFSQVMAISGPNIVH
jgi:hypothetical protein